MAIKLRFINVIIPIANIERCYPGGFNRFKADTNGYENIWFDDYIVRDGAMNPMDVEMIIEIWEALGLQSREVIDEKRHWKDICVVEALIGGKTLPCEWLVVNKDGTVSHIDELAKMKSVDFFLEAAERKEDAGDYKGALAEYDKVLEVCNHPLSCLRKAGVYDAMGNDKAVLEWLNMALAIDGYYADAYINRALYHRHHRNYEAAEKDYEKAMELEPKVFDIGLFNEEDIFKYAKLSEISNPEKGMTFVEGELFFEIYLSSADYKGKESDTYLTIGIKDMPYFFLYWIFPKIIYNQKLIWFQFKLARQIFKFKTYVFGMKVRPLSFNKSTEIPMSERLTRLQVKDQQSMKVAKAETQKDEY